ncbi:MAG: hypothetical protein ABEJ72_02300 [Candidatus Aenigmatarchaeota archaeon]
MIESDSGGVLVPEDMGPAKQWLSHREWLIARIKWNQRYIEDLQYMKKEESQQDDGLSNGRRRWLNREMEDARQKIMELDQELQNLE